MDEVTLCVPFFRNCGMLRRQVEEWNLYPKGIRVILVDDGSPEPAQPIVEEYATTELLERVELYRILINKEWNRSGARNLASARARTEWILHVDIDHILPADAAYALLAFEPDPHRWYRFPRWRKGKADETRMKDAIPRETTYAQIHPHVDSYLIRNKKYWKVGGYDEDFSGSLGGGSLFLQRLSDLMPCDIFAPPIRLEVYTRSEIPDASDWSLSRDKTQYAAMRKQKIATGDLVPKNPLRFPWERVELSKYPKVIGEFATVDALLEGKSIARIGDGELKLMNGGEYFREPPNEKLAAELLQVMQHPHENCLVGVPTMSANGPKGENWLRHKARFAKLVNPQVQYYSAFITRPDSAPWIYTEKYAEKIEKLWRAKRVVVLAEPLNKILTVVRRSAREVVHFECPHREAYSQIDRFEQQIWLVNNPGVVLLSCGPTATCLANRLAARGIHAVDIGSAGGFLLKLLTTKSSCVPSSVAL